MTELQENTRWNVLHTLEYLANAEQQKAYKKTVPFLNIPVELVSQWKSYAELRNKEWYIEIWSESEMKALNSFDSNFSKLFGKARDNLADIPEILEDEMWITIMKEAALTLRLMR